MESEEECAVGKATDSSWALHKCPFTILILLRQLPQLMTQVMLSKCLDKQMKNECISFSKPSFQTPEQQDPQRHDSPSEWLIM